MAMQHPDSQQRLKLHLSPLYSISNGLTSDATIAPSLLIMPSTSQTKQQLYSLQHQQYQQESVPTESLHTWGGSSGCGGGGRLRATGLKLPNDSCWAAAIAGRGAATSRETREPAEGPSSACVFCMRLRERSSRALFGVVPCCDSLAACIKS